jgi:predicted RecA/RadA family phage recombinase
MAGTVSTVDGLGYEEVGQEVTLTDILSGTNVYGTTSGVFAKLESTTAVITSGTVATINIDYADKKGVYIDNMPTEANLSGGMWVIGSAGSATTPVPLLKPVNWPNGTPLGICLADISSGGTPDVLVRGFYHGLYSEDAALAVGDVIQCGVGGSSVGRGGSYSCVMSIGSDTAYFDAGFARGVCVMAAGSEEVAAVYLW